MTLFLAILASLSLLQGQVGTVSVSGTATWYCSASSPCTRGYGPGSAVAAIDPGLGFRKGDTVVVTGDAGSKVVRIVDVCACKGSRIIDLTSSVFRAVVGPLSKGIGVVVVEGTDAIPLPPTDTVQDQAYWLNLVR